MVVKVCGTFSVNIKLDDNLTEKERKEEINDIMQSIDFNINSDSSIFSTNKSDCLNAEIEEYTYPNLK